MVRQLDLFAAAVPIVGFDRAFGGCVRHELSEDARVEHVPGWVNGHDQLFDELEAGLAWRSESMTMWDKTVAVPRLLANVPKDGPG